MYDYLSIPQYCTIQNLVSVQLATGTVLTGIEFNAWLSIEIPAEDPDQQGTGRLGRAGISLLVAFAVL